MSQLLQASETIRGAEPSRPRSTSFDYAFMLAPKALLAQVQGLVHLSKGLLVGRKREGDGGRHLPSRWNAFAWLCRLA